MGVWQRVANVFSPKAELTENLSLEQYMALLTEQYGVRTSSGVNVSPETALRQTTVLICVRVLAESVASLPCILYKRRKDGGKDRADGQPLYRVLHDKANGWNTSFEYFEGTMTNLATRGNGYSYIDRNSKGQTVGLIPLNPDGINITQNKDWSPQYHATMPDNTRSDLSSSEMHHIRGPLPKGYYGRSMIALARDAVGLGLATEKFGSALFENGAKPSGVLSHPKVLLTPAQDRLKTQFAERHSGLDNAHKPLILEEGMTWTALSINPDDAQFLETRKFQRSEIAGIFRVPAHFVNDMEKATFSNIEHQSLDFVMHSLRPWLVRFEQAINRDLLSPDERNDYFVEFLVDGLLRGDFFTRMQGYALQIQNHLATPNEIRIKENNNPYAGGDKMVETNNIGTPGNNVPGKKAA
jgi:HK97 family phage portal protein